MGNEELIEISKNYDYWLRSKKPKDDRVLDAVGKVERKEFLPDFSKEFAHMDAIAEIGYGSVSSQPSLIALIADLLEIEDDLNILEIGTGSGYSAALISHLMGIGKGNLTTIEIVPQLAKLAKANLEKHFGSISSMINVVVGDGSLGYIDNAPYDRIYLTAAVDIRRFDPKILVDQLNEDGILIFPEMTTNSLFIYRKSSGEVKEEKHEGVFFVPLKGNNS
ncbi:MAG: protein-L-isoaspartate O-methyltransferase family protein [Candidatus Woesearchaeota archaeon]